MTLQANVCIVTGGGRGLGAATARFLAANGAAVAVCARTADEVDQVAAELVEGGARAIAGAVDVADQGSVDAFAERVVDTLGTPDLLVNNAAMLGPVGQLLDTDLAAWRRTIEVNLVGTVVTTKRFGGLMRASGRGTIVNLSGGGVGGPGVAPALSAYTASKAAVAQLTETLAAELAAHGINVVAIAPGAMSTSFTDGILEAGPDVAGAALYSATEQNRSKPAQLDDYERLLAFVTGSGRWLTGVLLSARWDRPEALEAARERIQQQSLYRLRRIDDDLFHESDGS